MLIIKHGKLCVDKGDAGEIAVSVMDSDGCKRQLKLNDKFVLTISAKPSGTALMQVSTTITSAQVGDEEAIIKITASDWSAWTSAACGRYTGKIVFYPENSATEHYTIFPPMEPELCQVEDINLQNVLIRP